MPHESGVISSSGSSNGIAHLFFPPCDAESFFVPNSAVEVVPCRVPAPNCEDEFGRVRRLPNSGAVESKIVVFSNRLYDVIADGLRRVLVDKTIPGL